MHDKTQEYQWEKFSDAKLVVEGQGQSLEWLIWSYIDSAVSVTVAHSPIVV